MQGFSSRRFEAAIGVVALVGMAACASEREPSEPGTQHDTSATEESGGGTGHGETGSSETGATVTSGSGTSAAETETTDTGADNDEPGCSAPYALPGPGEAVDIPIDGRNVAVDVKPPAHGDGSWQYALFQSYGGGSFSRDHSECGAYVIAGTGGHGASPCLGGAIFDFTTGTWEYLPNANGFDEARTTDVDRITETNGSPYLELTNVTTPGMPAPAHNYQLQISPPKDVTGGAKGVVIRTVGAAQTTEAWDSPQSHLFDLDTGMWSRASDNLLTDVFAQTPYTDSVAAYDPSFRRIYLLLGHLSYVWAVPYLDLDDATWKLTESFDWPQPDGYVRTMIVDDDRRLLLTISTVGELWGFDLDNIGNGPALLDVGGTVPTARLRWDLYPARDGGDGGYYAFSGVGPGYEDVPPYPLADEQTLHKLTPPASSPRQGTWTFSTVEIDGGLTAEYVIDPSAGAHHHTRFFYVPSLGVFAWIPNGTGPVQLIKP